MPVLPVRATIMGFGTCLFRQSEKRYGLNVQRSGEWTWQCCISCDRTDSYSVCIVRPEETGSRHLQTSRNSCG